jgi:predicted ATPase
MRIQNFKAWRDTGKIRLAPITVFFGANSAGKTSLLQFLLMLKQTAESPDRRRVLHLGDSYSLVDLGNFKDIAFRHTTDKPLSFALSWNLSKERSYHDPTDKNVDIAWSELAFEAGISVDSKGSPRLDRFSYKLIDPEEHSSITVELKQSSQASTKYSMRSESYSLTRTVGRGWDLRAPVRFYGFPDEATIYYQNAGFVSDLTLEFERQLQQVYYLGPLRQDPRRTYSWSGEVPQHVGTKGERSVEAILASKDRRIVPKYRARGLTFSQMISKWLDRLGLLSQFDAREIAKDRKEYEVSVQTQGSDTSVLLPDVGFGVSQVLPVVVECFYAPANSTVVIEQPELHLHPRVQSELADLFIEAIRARENDEDRGMQFIIESHSEHFLRRLQRRVAEGVIGPKDVALYYCEPGEDGAQIRELPVDLFGEIDSWPDDFFGDEFLDIAARLEAASKREQTQNA